MGSGAKGRKNTGDFPFTFPLHPSPFNFLPSILDPHPFRFPPVSPYYGFKLPFSVNPVSLASISP
jgi:hypothetical protein